MVLCSNVANEDGGESANEVTFAILDVGQGLSQAGIKDKQAVFWDMGDRDAFASWQSGFATLGSPYISAIIISHGDMDHKGGLADLPAAVPFSGLVITSPYEDTAALRVFAGNWSSRLYFRTVKQGDTTALLNGVYIECIWPPHDSATLQWAEDNFTPNRFSLCFRVVYGSTSVMITGDIDTVSEALLTEKYKTALASDIIVVPHHGSKGSLHSLFYGYVDPQRAVISCGVDNLYGHPADNVMKFLALQMVVTISDTRYEGHVIGRSNGEYWVWQ